MSNMDSTSIGMIAALIFLVMMSAYFSATETAFTSLNRIRLKNRADNGDRSCLLYTSPSPRDRG